ncbi:DUF6999 family protein [Caulobacter sp. KR2-114]|uniref:DUF6999 family protein n=1 Tax=Caulobacter sp. KR2-114 TaxID=3400912 RepID=UPI003C0C87F2
MRPPDFDPTAAYDPRQPDRWRALWLDRSLPLADEAKTALVSGARSGSRRWLAPAIRPGLWALMVVARGLRTLSPRRPNLNGVLHRLIHWGLRRFASPQANRLILRHFHIGTELLGFIAANAGPVRIDTTPLRPRTLRALQDDAFLQHDLNVFNFVIQLNAGLREQGRELSPPAQLDFSMISDGPFDLEPLPAGPLNVIDVQTAIEAYLPLYALMLPRDDFERAAHSLQLDETIAIYVARILGSDYHLNFVKNGCPLMPASPFGAARRLMLHGLDCEALHGWLRQMKARQAAGLPMAA